MLPVYVHDGGPGSSILVLFFIFAPLDASVSTLCHTNGSEDSRVNV